MVPEGWRISKVSDVATVKVGRDVDESRFSQTKSEKHCYPVFSNSVGDLGLYGFYDFAEYKSDSVTVVGRGVGLGTAFAREGGFGAIGRLLVLEPKNSSFDFIYFENYINNRLKIHNESSGIPQLPGKQIEKYTVTLPPLPEQKKIAKILSTWDRAIATTEKLLANSQQQKKALMQQLLTGKTRFPGFTDEWKEVRVDNFVSLRKVKFDPKKENEVRVCIELEHLEQNTGRLVGWLDTHEKMSQKSVFEANDVLFGKLRPYLRKYWFSNRCGVCSSEIWVLKSKENMLPSFLYQLVQTDRFIEVSNISSGTHMPRADWKVVKCEKFHLPTLLEQQKIASVLSSADKEIESLQQKLSHLKQEKKALMQQLLTGKRRVKVD